MVQRCSQRLLLLWVFLPFAGKREVINNIDTGMDGHKLVYTCVLLGNANNATLLPIENGLAVEKSTRFFRLTNLEPAIVLEACQILGCLLQCCPAFPDQGAMDQCEPGPRPSKHDWKFLKPLVEAKARSSVLPKEIVALLTAPSCA